MTPTAPPAAFRPAEPTGRRRLAWRVLTVVAVLVAALAAVVAVGAAAVAPVTARHVALVRTSVARDLAAGYVVVRSVLQGTVGTDAVPSGAPERAPACTPGVQHVVEL